MDGGIGESLLFQNILTGAAIGGGLSALTGGNVLSGALTGGLGGGIKGLLPDFTKFMPGGANATEGINVANAATTVPGANVLGSQAAADALSSSTLGSNLGSAFNPTDITKSAISQGVPMTNPLTQLGTPAAAPVTEGIGSLVPKASYNTAQIGADSAFSNVPSQNPITGMGTQATPAATVGQTATSNTLTPDQMSKISDWSKMKPIDITPTNLPAGTIVDNGIVGPNGIIYDKASVASAIGSPPSFYQKYKMPILLGGAGLAAMSLNQKPKFPTFQQPNYPKFGLASNYQAVPNPTPVYPTFADGGIASLSEGGNLLGRQQANVDFMHGDMYPMSQQIRSFYATPTQMPTSAQQAMASYEPKTNPLTGELTSHMADGGITNSAPGSQVYYDSQKQQYYTNITPQNSGTSNIVDFLKYGARNHGRNYLGNSLAGGEDSTFKTPQITPPVYTPSYTDVAVPNTTTPAASVNTPQYSLADSTSLLQSVLEQPPVKKARGGISDLGSYSDGGRMLEGPGDGMSDSIPGIIADKRPARLAEGEFVVPADVVSHLGNGSTNAGAKHLYKMMDRIRQARTGRKKQGSQINPSKYMPA